MSKLFLLGLFLLAACQTTTLVQEFSQIQKGTERGEVIERVGSPNRRERKEYRDWWYYRFYENGKNHEYLIILEDAKVKYIGSPKILRSTDLDAEEARRIQENEAAAAEQVKPVLETQ